MKEEFVPLPEQPTSLQNGCSLQQLEDSSLGLSITVTDRAKKWIEVEFDEPVAHRCYLEETQAYFWPEFHKRKQGPGSIYNVSNSQWLKDFDKADLIHYATSEHYLIVTDQKRIDVISCNPPKITVMDRHG